MAKSAAAARAVDASRAYNVFHSRESSLSTLRRVECDRPVWWNARCSAFVRAVEAASCERWCGPHAKSIAQSTNPNKRHAIIVLEGLDGVGKSRTAAALARRLACVHTHRTTTHSPCDATSSYLDRSVSSKNQRVRNSIDGKDTNAVTNKSIGANRVDESSYSVMSWKTPPQEWSDVRACFDVPQSPGVEHVTRAFYSAANYLTAQDMLTAVYSGGDSPTGALSDVPHSATRGVTHCCIVDRWWCSTCAMALSHRCTRHNLPARHSPVYAWPDDLPMFDVGILLRVSEHVRQQRIERRKSSATNFRMAVTYEERQLAAQQEMREVAMEAYRRTGLLQELSVSNYREAVNAILTRICEQRLVCESSVRKYSEQELAEVEPY